MTCIYLFDIFSCILIAVNVKRKVFTLYLLKYVWFSAVSLRARCLLSQIHLNIINKKKISVCIGSDYFIIFTISFQAYKLLIFTTCT